MEKYIKYKRISKEVNSNTLETLFDELISGGWEIIYYDEDYKTKNLAMFNVTIVAGKKQSNVL